MDSLQGTLIQKLNVAGWKVRSDGGNISAEREDILSKWILGKRSVKLQLELQFDEPGKTLHFREVAMERSSGLPPPVFSMTMTTQNGIMVSEHRSDVGIGGGGTMDYGNARLWIEQLCRNEGWTFKFEI